MAQILRLQNLIRDQTSNFKPAIILFTGKGTLIASYFQTWVHYSEKRQPIGQHLKV